jgi:hypothetical protein
MSCTVFIVALLAWRRRRSFARFASLVKELWQNRIRIWPILKKKRIRWRFRRKPKNDPKAARDSDLVFDDLGELQENELPPKEKQEAT